MLTIIFCWIVLFFVIFQIGRFILGKKLLSILHIKGTLEWYEYFWVGLVGVIAILQIWSIFLPVNENSLGFVFVLAVFSFGINPKLHIRMPKLSFVILGGLILLIISYFASLTVGWEDTNLYHLNMVKWSNVFAVVPGLANLHSRFGLNSSFFLFASMIDNWFLKNRSSHVALSLLAAVISVEFFWIISKTGKRINKIFCVFILPLLVSCVVNRTIIASVSPDLVLTIVVFAISLEFLKGDKKALLIAGLLSLLLVTVKLNGIVFAGILLILVLLKTKKKQIVFFITASGVLLLTSYIIRNVALSGWPFYPLPLFGFNVPWAVPGDSVSGMFSLIKTWAISPGPDWFKSSNLPFWQWFPGWYSRNSWNIEVKILLFAVFLLIISPFTKVFSKERFKALKNYYFLGAAALVSILYVLFTVPDFRFGEVYIWVFFAVATAIYVDLFIHKNYILKIVVAIIGVGLMLLVSLPLRIDGKPIWRSVRWEFSAPVDKVVIVPKDGSPPFQILVPKDGMCSNSDLPCTPELNNIREIVPGDISKGFAPVR